MQGFETQRPQGQQQRPQNFQIEQTNLRTSKRKRLYQEWVGSEKFFCGGRIIGGPGWKTSFLTAFVVLVPTALFLAFVGWPLRDLSIAIFIVGCALTVLSEIFLFVTAFTEPGVIPRQPPDNEGRQGLKPSTKEVTVNDSIVVIRYNATCNFYQPPRAHHCSVNDNCIERFDHHCPWIGTTIGQRNYRTFLLFVLTSTVLCLYVMAFCVIYGVNRGYRLGSQLRAEGKDKPKPIDVVRFENVAWAMALFIVGIICFLFVGCLSAFHCWLVAKNQTTYENFRYASANRPNPYDRGCFKNCAEVWCLRIQPSHIQARKYMDELEPPSSDLPVNIYLKPPFSNYHPDFVKNNPQGLIPKGQRPSKIAEEQSLVKTDTQRTQSEASYKGDTNNGSQPQKYYKGGGEQVKSPKFVNNSPQPYIESKLIDQKRQKPDDNGHLHRVHGMPKVGTKSVQDNQEYQQVQQQNRNRASNGTDRPGGDAFQSPVQEKDMQSQSNSGKSQKKYIQRDLDRQMLGQTQQKPQVAQSRTKQPSQSNYNNAQNQQQQYVPSAGSNKSSRHSSQPERTDLYPMGSKKRTSSSDHSSQYTYQSSQQRKQQKYPNQADSDSDHQIMEQGGNYNGDQYYNRPKRATKTNQQQAPPKSYQKPLSLQDIQLMSDEINSTNQSKLTEKALNDKVRTTASQQERLKQLARRQKEKQRYTQDDDREDRPIYNRGNYGMDDQGRQVNYRGSLQTGNTSNSFQEQNDNSVSQDIKRLSATYYRPQDKRQGSQVPNLSQQDQGVMLSLESSTTQSNDTRDSNMLLPKNHGPTHDKQYRYNPQNPQNNVYQQGHQRATRGNGSRKQQDDAEQYMFNPNYQGQEQRQQRRSSQREGGYPDQGGFTLGINDKDMQKKRKEYVQ